MPTDTRSTSAPSESIRPEDPSPPSVRQCLREADIRSSPPTPACSGSRRKTSNSRKYDLDASMQKQQFWAGMIALANQPAMGWRMVQPAQCPLERHFPATASRPVTSPARSGSRWAKQDDTGKPGRPTRLIAPTSNLVSKAIEAGEILADHRQNERHGQAEAHSRQDIGLAEGGAILKMTASRDMCSDRATS